MRIIFAVIKRELSAALTRLSTYAAGAALTCAVGAAVAFGPTLKAGAAELSDGFAILPWALAGLVPVITAVQWGRDAETGLRESLMSISAPGWALVIGRWAAGYVIVLVWLLLSLSVVFSLYAAGRLDAGLAFAGVKASAWAAGAYLAIASAAGAIARSVVGAYVGGAVLCCAATVFGWTPAHDAAALVIGERAADWMAAASTPSRLEAARFGVLTAQDAFYFVSLAVLGLVLAGLAQAARREALQ